MAGEVEHVFDGSQLFSLLDGDGRKRLIEVAEEVVFPARTVIVREGEQGDSFYVIVSGTVQVEANALDGARQIATLGAGAIFGEIAALTREPRTATITTERETEVLRFDAGPVLEILKDYPVAIETLNRLGIQRSEETLERMLSD